MPKDEVTLEADALRVVFFRQGDRYAHRIETFDAARNEWIAALESLEGEPGDEWPPSPPFQQLHVERRPAGAVVLLIGMAGRTHWSAAVEVAADRKSITFDVAARVAVRSPWVGSRYQELAPKSAVKIISVEPTSAVSPFVVDAKVPDCVPATIPWKYAFRT